MVIDNDQLKADQIFNWNDDDNYLLLRYWTKRSQRANSTTEFILAFKNGDPTAMMVAKQVAEAGVGKIAAKLRNELKCTHIVAVPSSRAGILNKPCEELCRHLAYKYAWLTHIPGALTRVKTVVKSAYAHGGNRPGVDEHLSSIKYTGLKLDLRGRSIIMVDDILTRGATSDACRQILLEATKADHAIGIFLGRTQ